MEKIVTIALENELDLILVHKRAIKIGDLLDLRLSSQTSFATAVSEICREVLEKINNGLLSIGVADHAGLCWLVARIRFEKGRADLDHMKEGITYARRLITELNISSLDNQHEIELKTKIPKKQGNLAVKSAEDLRNFFENSIPETPYELVKANMVKLNQKTKDQLEQIEYSTFLNDKKDEFLSIASHELKTPLTSLKAFTQLALLANDENCSPTIKSYLRRIDDQASKINKMIQQLLDISKIEAGKMEYFFETISLNKFIKEVVEIIEKIIPGHQINLDLESEFMVRIDKLKMEQVFSNLIGNAAKYSPPNSSIFISTSEAKGEVTVKITDQGIGIAENNWTRVFEKYFREENAHKRYAGFGMGLYITSKIVTDHKGRIWLDSITDKGSTFYFTIPLVNEVVALS